MLLVGEVRDTETAQVMLRAASNGFLVICTSFGTDLISSIDSFFQLLRPESSGTLAGSLRCILHQRLLNEQFSCEMLTSDSPSSRVATLIRARNITQLKDELMYQRNALLAGHSLSKQSSSAVGFSSNISK